MQLSIQNILTRLQAVPGTSADEVFPLLLALQHKRSKGKVVVVSCMHLFFAGIQPVNVVEGYPIFISYIGICEALRSAERIRFTDGCACVVDNYTMGEEDVIYLTRCSRGTSF